MKRIVQFLSIALFIVFAFNRAKAQEIWGMSTISFDTVTVYPQPEGVTIGRRPPNPGPCRKCPHWREVSAYADTEEDYIASLYYDVTSNSAIYMGGNSYASASNSFTGNPSASGSFSTEPLTGSHSNFAYELTDHIVDFFYVSSYGAYYDPYGFSVVLNPNDPSEDYDSGYWFSVVVYARYVTEASIVLGEDMDAGTDTWGYNFQGPNVETLMYQAFIPPDWIVGPACCQLSD